jgi:hypothetical protein
LKPEKQAVLARARQVEGRTEAVIMGEIYAKDILAGAVNVLFTAYINAVGSIPWVTLRLANIAVDPTPAAGAPVLAPPTSPPAPAPPATPTPAAAATLPAAAAAAVLAAAAATPLIAAVAAPAPRQGRRIRRKKH